MDKSLMRLLLLPAVVIVAVIAASCNKGDDVWNNYEEWRVANTEFYNEQKFAIGSDGQPRYQTLTPAWNNSASILINWLNDRKLTEDNLSPLLTSKVAVKYRGALYNGVAFDSSYRAKDSLFTTTPGNVISGWTIALLNMHVGDSVEVVIPYVLGYGVNGSGVSIPPFSTLVFNIKLVDILDYEVRP
ncbi:MAG: FKBP-type peptidyl-prolyl cis-trans isomerase [Duncaniella sp.]|nr:FKBP-type peptidyl-prolyl cis-trans isomerase [Duncaniella sp.]